ncbi:MAG TPA: hypothetical protein VM531_05270, partial [Sphingomicrobium sp.]|nr:hypothetical protein [Sphingomicrobium sp.]
RNGSTVLYPSLLTGMVSDPDGRPMTPVFTSKGSTRHHYYVSRLKPGEKRGLAWRVPAGEIDRAAVRIVGAHLLSPDVLSKLDADEIRAQRELADDLSRMSVPAQRDMLIERGVKVTLGTDGIHVQFTDVKETATISLPARVVHRGPEKRIVVDGDEGGSPDPVLAKLVAHALSLRSATLSGKPDNLTGHYSKRHRWQLLRIAFLAPDILGAIMEGRQPPGLTGRRLLRATDIPLDWNEQRRLLGFA